MRTGYFTRLVPTSFALFVACAGCDGGSEREAGTDGDGWQADSSDAGIPDVDPGECGFQVVAYQPLGEIIQTVSGDQDTCVKMVRKIKAGAGCSGISTDFDLQSLTVGHAGETVVITDPGSMQYRCTLHNWYDEAEGTHQGVRYHLDMDVDGQDFNTIHYFVQASDATNQQALWGPVEMSPFRP